MSPKREGKQKKRNQRKAKPRNGLVGPCATRSIAPASKRVFLGYQGKFVITEAAAGVGATYAYRLNSLFDPDSTGVGSQPLWFDQMAAMYAQFRVLRARVHLEMYNAESAPAQLGVFATYQAVVPSDPMSWGVQPFSKYVNAGNANAASAKFTMSITVDIPTIMGITPKEFESDSDFICTNAGNATRTAFLVLYVIGLRTTATTAVGSIAIQYEVECMQPQALNLS